MTYYVLAKKMPKGLESTLKTPDILKGKGFLIARFDTIKHAKNFIKNSNELLDDCDLSVWKENGTQIKI